jgi:hypothetical protein
MNTAATVLAALVLSVGAACAQSSIPDPAHNRGATNPDVTQDTIASTICVSGWTATVRPPSNYTNVIKRRQMVAYGLPGSPADYEEDHLVPLAVGGDPRSVQNLWPEPWHPEDGYGAGEKDQLENEIHRRVCRGEMSLKDGQAMFVPDWRSAYDALIGGK